MTDLKFSILEALYMTERRKKPLVDLINLYTEQHLINEAAQMLKDLKQDGLVTIDSSDIVELTKLGRTIYESVKEERHHQTECERREQESERRARESECRERESARLAKESVRLSKISNVIAIVSAVAAVLAAVVAILQFFR